MQWTRVTVAALVGTASALFGCAQEGTMGPGQGPASGTIYGRIESGWIILLENASSLENWDRVGNTHWREIEGAIQADRGSGYLVSKDRYTDFQLRAEFWVDNDADSGVLFRCSNPGNVGATSCYEANIQDKNPEPGSGTGAIVGIAPTSQIVKAAGHWNVYDITARGSLVTVVLNGVRTVSGRDTRFASGPIALQYDGGVVRFRRVQIRPL